MAHEGYYETLRDLTKVTHKCLGSSIEEGPTVPWVIAQRISTSQKVELSIRCVLSLSLYTLHGSLLIVVHPAKDLRVRILPHHIMFALRIL